MSTPSTFLVLLLLAVPAPAAAQYTFSPDELFVGQDVTVSLPALADTLADTLTVTYPDTLTVTYRPNSSIPFVEHIPTGGEQTVTWTPRQAGVIALSTPSGEVQNVSVRFRSVPGSGLFVLATAGLILFGGIVFAFRKMFGEE